MILPGDDVIHWKLFPEKNKNPLGEIWKQNNKNHQSTYNPLYLAVTQSFHSIFHAQKTRSQQQLQEKGQNAHYQDSLQWK